MRFMLLFLAFFPSKAFAIDTWVVTGSYRLYTGQWNYPRSNPLRLDNPILSNQYRVSFPSHCGAFEVRDFFFKTDTGVIFQQNPSGGGPIGNREHLVYKFSEPKKIVAIGFQAFVDAGDCTFTIDQPALPAPIPDNPTNLQCERVASLMFYEYGLQLEQASALAGPPCFVFLRFKSLQDYRVFLDDRRNRNLSPDFHILLPDNVKVDLDARIQQLELKD